MKQLFFWVIAMGIAIAASAQKATIKLTRRKTGMKAPLLLQ